MEKVAQISLLVYAVLMSVGGIIGFRKSQSKASLIAGLGSGIALVGAYVASMSNIQVGLYCGIGITWALLIVFGIRIAKTKKFMPSGMLLAISAIEELVLLLGIFLKP